MRREWLAGFVTRKTAPKGAEALICEAVVGGHYTLSKAMDHRHPMIFRLLDAERPGTHGGLIQACDTLAARATTPKASTMVTLAVVVAAWEDATGRHSWRNPTAWDARVLGALVEWGYEPSEVERIVLGEEPASVQADATDDTTDDTTDEASDSAA